jgi:hypothetical protein
MGSLGDTKSDHWQTHSDEHQFAVVDLSRCRRDHQFAF